MSFKQLAPVLDALVAAVFIVDAQRQILFANNAALQQFDARLVGVDFVQAIRDPECLSAMDKVLSGRKHAQVEVTLQNPVRTTYSISISRIGAKGRPKDKTDARAIVTLENISHIYEAELMRSEFVANVSHELRSPLTALNGFIETLKGPAKNDKKAQKRFLNIMAAQAIRMNRLVGDLLSLSKVETNQHMRPTEQVDIVNLVEQAIQVLENLAKGEKVRVGFKRGKNVPETIIADEDQLLQVLLNLLENAIKYGGHGGKVDISISESSRAPGIRGPAICVEFRDYGPGIPAEHIPRLTERFYRVDTGRSREKGGTGLGLAIVKHIVARHRGRLQIISGEGEGSRFRVFLPVMS